MYDTAGESLKRLAEAKLSLAARTTSLKALEHRLARASEDFLNAKPGVRRDELQELVGELTVSVADARAAARASNSTFRRARQASLGSLSLAHAGAEDHIKEIRDDPLPSPPPFTARPARRRLSPIVWEKVVPPSWVAFEVGAMTAEAKAPGAVDPFSLPRYAPLDDPLSPLPGLPPDYREGMVRGDTGVDDDVDEDAIARAARNAKVDAKLKTLPKKAITKGLLKNIAIMKKGKPSKAKAAKLARLPKLPKNAQAVAKAAAAKKAAVRRRLEARLPAKTKKKLAVIRKAKAEARKAAEKKLAPRARFALQATRSWSAKTEAKASPAKTRAAEKKKLAAEVKQTKKKETVAQVKKKEAAVVKKEAKKAIVWRPPPPLSNRIAGGWYWNYLIVREWSALCFVLSAMQPSCKGG